MRYEFELQGNYGYGWDTLTTCDTRKEANQTLRTYQENDKQVISLRVKRVKAVA